MSAPELQTPGADTINRPLHGDDAVASVNANGGDPYEQKMTIRPFLSLHLVALFLLQWEKSS